MGPCSEEVTEDLRRIARRRNAHLPYPLPFDRYKGAHLRWLWNLRNVWRFHASTLVRTLYRLYSQLWDHNSKKKKRT